MGGDPAALKDYEGGRELKDLEKFAAENLGPTCGPDNLDLCDAVDKKFIEKFKKWDIDEQEAKVNKIEAEGKKVVGKIDKQISDLNDKIEKKGKKKDKAIEKAKKEANYYYLKAVKASRTPKLDKDHDPDLADDKEEVISREHSCSSGLMLRRM